MHSLSNKYNDFGLSEDVVLGRGKSTQLTLLMPPLPKIEDFIMQELFKSIKSKSEKIEPATGKFLISFEFDLEKLSNAVIRLQNNQEEKK